MLKRFSGTEKKWKTAGICKVIVKVKDIFGALFLQAFTVLEKSLPLTHHTDARRIFIHYYVSVLWCLCRPVVIFSFLAYALRGFVRVCCGSMVIHTEEHNAAA